jgi:preprotein translocase subunit YajC
VFISNAYAQSDAFGLSGGGLMSLWPFLAMFAAMYFLMIRPQMKRQKEVKAMLDALGKGDEVVTSGGLLGKVNKITDVYVTLEVASGAEFVVQKSAVTMLLPKGTLKGL